MWAAFLQQALRDASEEQVRDLVMSIGQEERNKILTALQPLLPVVEDAAVATGAHYVLQGNVVDGLFAKLKIIFAEMVKGQSNPDFKLDYLQFAATGDGYEHVRVYREHCAAQAPAWRTPDIEPWALEMYDDQVIVEDIGSSESPIIGGPEFHPEANLSYGHIYKVKGKPETARPCMVYCHGGACIAGFPKILDHVMVRYAVQCDMTVITISYRVAPENPVPLAGKDAYAATKWVIANADALGVDPNRVTVWGDSGGSKTATSCAMNFADQSEGHLLKFFGAFASVTGNQYLRDGDDDGLLPHEKGLKPMQAAVAKLFTPDDVRFFLQEDASSSSFHWGALLYPQRHGGGP